MKILILSCNTGEGHNSCARAISEELERKGDWGYIADGLAFLSTGTSKFVSGWHTRLYRYFPRLYGKGYEYAEKHPMNIKKHTAAYRMIRRGASRLRKVIKAGGYDGVICTHLFPAMMVTGLVKKGTVTIPACFVATDYTASPGCEKVSLPTITPHPDLTGEFQAVGIPAENILAYGIPVRSMFTEKTDKAEAKRKAGLDPERLHMVIMGGSMGCGPMEDVLAEAKHLADAGVKECIVIAQDITRYGIDLYGEKKLAALLRELCKLDFRWIRLHYLYPDEFTDELIDTIAAEEKVLPYLDIPIQHCNDRVLKAMNRRGDKAELLALFRELRARIPNLVLRTSLITGLPFEDEAAFEELCEFLQEVRIERAGVFPYSPEEGTPAARMLNRVDTAEAERRAELVVDVQSRIMDDFNDSRMGTVAEVLCDGFDQEAMQFVGRSYAESPDIDGRIYFTADHEVEAGEFVPVRITGTMDGELTGELAE